MATSRKASLGRGMLVLLALAFLAAAALLLLLVRAKSEEGSGFSKAVVEILVDEDGKFLPPNRRVTVALADAKEIETLARFFPGLGKGRKSPRAAGWVAAIVIVFHSSDGKMIRVTVSPEGEDPTVWSEGRGDWPVKGNIKVQMEKLRKRTTGSVATQPATQPAAGRTTLASMPSGQPVSGAHRPEGPIAGQVDRE